MSLNFRWLNRDFRWQWLIPILVLLASLAITQQFWRNARRVSVQEQQAEFDFRMREANRRIAQRMRTYEEVLRGARGLFAASATLDRRGFREYVDSLQLQQDFPGIEGIGFTQIVLAEQRAEHVAALRREGFPEYDIRPMGKRDVYTSVIYLEPFKDRNLRAFGYDMYSESVRRQAMAEARDNGVATLSGRVTLVQEEQERSQFGCLMYLPVYRPGALHGTVAERRTAIVGWVYAAFRMGDLMANLFGERAKDLEICIYDGDRTEPEMLMFNSDNTPEPRQDARFQTPHSMWIAGHAWTTMISSQPVFEARQNQDSARIIAAVGVGWSLLLTLLLYVLLTGRLRAESLVQQRTEELLREKTALQAERANLTAIFEASPVGMVVLDEQAGIVKENATAIALTSGNAKPLSPQTLGNYLCCAPNSQDPHGCGIGPECVQCRLHQAIKSVFAGETLHGTDFAIELLRDQRLQTVWLRVGARQLQFNDHPHIIMALDDVTAQKLATEKLREWNLQMANELELAGILQKALLSIKPVLTPRFQADASYRSSLQVGGDFFDIISLADGRICIYIGDVAGHGVAPAMISSMLKALLPELIRDHAAQGPAAVCNELHRHFVQLIHDPSLYATFSLAFLDPELGTLHGMNCGHPWPLLFDSALADAGAAFGCGGGIPIGVAATTSSPYASTDETRMTLPPGGAMLFYTDGLSEARHRLTGEISSADVVHQAFRSLLQEAGWKAEPGALFKRLEAAGYKLAADDCSIVMVSITNPGEIQIQKSLSNDLVAVSELGTLVTQALTGQGWPAVSAQKARLLAVEYCTNVVKHGDCPPGAPIQVQLAVHGQQCRFLFIDSGIEWDIQKYTVALDQVHEQLDHGRGLGIIQALSRHIRFCRHNNQNCALFVMEQDEG
jgi:CHASE1-domain containing sensor protein/serine phosphatase RsbU (regulator of sigma subunit)/anti-sigma regulatory factor (Ser/Thr protein kinase)